MVLELFTLAAIPTAVGVAEASRQQQILDDEAQSDSRRARFYLDVYCDAQSRKRDEVHDAIVVLREGKLYLWPKDPKTKLPRAPSDGTPPPHPFTGFYRPFPTSDLPPKPAPSTPVLGLVSTVPQEQPSTSNPNLPSPKPTLNWIYADKYTFELKYGPRVTAREHVVGPWDWTDEEEGSGLMFDGEESLIAVEEENGGLGWAVYWDRWDDRLKKMETGRTKRVLRCSLERRLVDKER